MHVACNFEFIIESEGVRNVTCSHICYYSGNLLETKRGRDVTTGEVIYDLPGSSCNNLSVFEGHFPYHKPF